MSIADQGLSWADEDGVVHIRNSERGTLDKCPQRWWWSWREGLRPKETPKALWFGSAIHEALADYYRPGKKRSKDYIDKFREYADMEEEYIKVNVSGEIDEAKWVDARALGEQMLRGYVEHYGGDKHWDVVATEQTFSVRIPWLTPEFITELKQRGVSPARIAVVEALVENADFNTAYFILNGTFDGVYYDLKEKRFKLMEHKTAGTIPNGPMPLDNQSGTYHMVAQTVLRKMGVLGPREYIKEITYNYLRKAMPDDRPTDERGYAHNKPTKAHFLAALEEAGVDLPKKYLVKDLETIATDAGLTVLGDRSARQPPPLYMRHPVRKTNAMRKQQLARLQNEVTKMALYVVGGLEVDKSPGKDTCSFCPYRDMCELHESGAGWTEFRDSMFRVEDLYAVHRKSA